jgi:hypothetical protein
MGPELPPGLPEPTEPARMRKVPEESSDYDKMAAKRRARKRTRGGQEEPEPRKLSKFEVGPSSYGQHLRASQDEVVRQVRRREGSWNFSPGRHPKVSELVGDPNFYRALNQDTYRGQLQADWPEILAGGAPQSKQILDDMLAQFFELYGVEPEW